MSKTVIDGNTLKEHMIQWTRDFFEKSGAKGAVVGISGGKDSSVVAALLVAALGKERVFGVLMPNGNQVDIHDSFALVEHLKLPHTVVNIHNAYEPMIATVAQSLQLKKEELSSVSTINLAPRLRMATLYMIAGQKDYLVAGTGNKSEAFVGYFTKWGDGAHDFNLLADLTTEEVVAVGHALKLPHLLANKTPTDGLSGKSDEENMGITYQQINAYIAAGTCGDATADSKIAQRHQSTQHKRNAIPRFTQLP